MEEDRPLGHSMVRTEGSGQHGGQGVEAGQECWRVWGHAVSRVWKEGRSEQAGRLGLGAGRVALRMELRHVLYKSRAGGVMVAQA